MRPITWENTEVRVRSNKRTSDQLLRRGPKPWVYVGDWFGDGDPLNDPSTTSVDSPPWQNGWANAGPPYDNLAFRHGTHWELEFKGHAEGGTSGAVAFTLPEAWRPDNDISFLTDVVNGASFAVARIFIESTTGDVTITTGV